MKITKVNEKYLEKAKNLSYTEVEQLLRRMFRIQAHRAADKKFTPIEILAIQLELEDEQLAEWRENLEAIRNKEKI
ncbi:hypothetical protein [Methylotenera sp.]|uniref:hypothetical protein n=1 Tax=Methylotenera sp. TaxID=2051956 RepID=UPI00272F4DDF|nr:hypothetical protein [Methylotenera sp.]MDP2071700.1 hypothetical protein [Methylotenera sp.]MDP2229368.1 hypothetical protein [Methylotenera sp.]MDP3007434.1 hypothetical protein [Methylotenera sp.]MDP3140526.1 hypothetical protein [Methylotenera sp.]